MTLPSAPADDWQPSERDLEILALWPTEIRPAMREHWQFLEEVLEAHHEAMARRGAVRARYDAERQRRIYAGEDVPPRRRRKTLETF